MVFIVNDLQGGAQMSEPIPGIHHVSALTANAGRNLWFYTRGLGMRIVKRSVNQDDPGCYHLFYADRKGSPGTDLTFFEIPGLAADQPGCGSISGIGLRVADESSFAFWRERFDRHGIAAAEPRSLGPWRVLPFMDGEGQRLMLVADRGRGVRGGEPWDKGGVPPEHGIRGLGPVWLTVAHLDHTARVLTQVLGFRPVGGYPSDVPGQRDVEVFSAGEGGAGAEIHVAERHDLPRARLGRGGVHHVALRVADDEAERRWLGRLEAAHLRTSGIIDRYYFRSIYFRDPNGILFELATDGPGFAVDEPEDHLGEGLALPPFLEPRRAEIEAHLHPLEMAAP